MVWAMVMYVGFGLAYTLVDVPAMGMMSVATPDKDERAGLLSFYVTVGSIGGLLPTVLYMVLDFFVPAKWIYFVLAVIVGLAAFAAYLYLYGHSKERFATSTEKIKRQGHDEGGRQEQAHGARAPHVHARLAEIHDHVRRHLHLHLRRHHPRARIRHGAGAPLHRGRRGDVRGHTAHPAHLQEVRL